MYSSRGVRDSGGTTCVCADQIALHLRCGILYIDAVVVAGDEISDTSGRTADRRTGVVQVNPTGVSDRGRPCGVRADVVTADRDVGCRVEIDSADEPIDHQVSDRAARRAGAL